MPKYRIKPTTFEAEQWSPGNAPIQGERNMYGKRFSDVGGNSRLLRDGDWIITNDDGSRELCTDKTFKKQYEEAEDDG